MHFAKSKLADLISECEIGDSLFEDRDFPASTSSLSVYKTLAIEDVIWLRTKDIIEHKKNYVADFYIANRDSLVSLKSGQFGSLELVGALAIISQSPCLVDNIVDMKQLMSDQESGPSILKCQKHGIFSFKFWYNGAWQEVVVDDRLPTDGSKKLVFISSDDRCNLLPSLLEKAYAKLLGSYESMFQCSLAEVLHHLTGGVVESLSLNRVPPPSFPFLVKSFFKALESQAPIGCFINISYENSGVRLKNGLLTCHQYVVNDIREIKLVLERGEIPLTLVRVKDPWGLTTDWKGSWNVNSPEWKGLSNEDRENMGLHLNSKSEFWMDIREFSRLFDLVEICNLFSWPRLSSSSMTSSSSSSTSSSPSPTPAIPETLKWHCQVFKGEWKVGTSAGGRPALRDTHWTNPQFRLVVKENVDQSFVTIIELSQNEDEERRDIGFVIYMCSKQTAFPLTMEWLERNNIHDRCDHFSDSRFITKRFSLKPGVYVIVPSTYKVDIEGSFVLRVLTSVPGSDIVPSCFLKDSPPRSSISSFQPDWSKNPVEEAIERHFLELSLGGQNINLCQMKLILNKYLKQENQAQDFSLELCKHLVSLIGKGCKTKVSLNEVLYLWNVAKSWRKTFNMFDKSEQGWVNTQELKSIILSLGYKFSPLVLDHLTYRYSNEQHFIELESFIICMVRILKLQEVFKTQEKNDKITCSIDEWLEMSLSIL